jgi:hypothetical protein
MVRPSDLGPVCVSPRRVSQGMKGEEPRYYIQVGREGRRLTAVSKKPALSGACMRFNSSAWLPDSPSTLTPRLALLCGL